MDKLQLEHFLQYCHELTQQKKYAEYQEEDAVWTAERKHCYQYGVIAGLYAEQNESFLLLLNQPCDHEELRRLLERYRTEYQKQVSEILHNRKATKKLTMPSVTEPLEKWIYDNNYGLACPFCGDWSSRDDTMFREKPEKVLSYVFLNLKQRYYELDYREDIFRQSNIKVLYEGVFDKSSVFRKWGLIPVDEQRVLCALDDPVRIYDSSLNKTIFLQVQRPLAMVFDELMKQNMIGEIAFRADDFYLYDGETHISQLMEAVETGRLFSVNVDELPTLSKLYSKHYEDSLWVVHEDNNLTFEELCEDICIEKDAVVTQVVHLQFDGTGITHLDHEYVFYDIGEYERRRTDYRVKGQKIKRIKTFKIDRSRIPFDYPCKAIQIREAGQEEIWVPFLYYVLNAYFKHKNLLKEYFEEVLE